MATNPIQRNGASAELQARRSWWASLEVSTPADQREQVRRLKAELSVTARIWQSRIAAGSFGNSWSLLRSTK
jgi:hypothetical protein